MSQSDPALIALRYRITRIPEAAARARFAELKGQVWLWGDDAAELRMLGKRFGEAVRIERYDLTMDGIVVTVTE